MTHFFLFNYAPTLARSRDSTLLMQNGFVDDWCMISCLSHKVFFLCTVGAFCVRVRTVNSLLARTVNSLLARTFNLLLARTVNSVLARTVIATEFHIGFVTKLFFASFVCGEDLCTVHLHVFRRTHTFDAYELWGEMVCCVKWVNTGGYSPQPLWCCFFKGIVPYYIKYSVYPVARCRRGLHVASQYSILVYRARSELWGRTCGET